MMADPFMPTDTGWEMETGWEVIGWCENPPACYRNKVERFYVGLMLQAPDGNDYWWHWMLARGEKAITDWRDSEWPTARHPNAEVSHAVGVGSTDWLGKPSENLTKTTNT
jgi:hypothetical protein